MSVTLNVIYTPKTAERLGFFAWSMLRWPDLRLRLIANGCSEEERQYLRDFSGADPRLSYMELPTETMWQHSRALDYLLAETSEKIFGFIDSDIFVVEPAVTPTLPDDCVAAFGCPKPVWRPAPLLKPVGCTYFALYRRDAVLAQIQSTGIGFEKYDWEQIPLAIQREIDEAGFREARYDTGQVLNILLVARGGRVGDLDSGSLRHVGNYSAITPTGRAPRSQNKRPGVRWWFGRVVRLQVRMMARQLYGMRVRKEAVNHYLNELLDALHSGKRAPRVPLYFPEPIRGQVKTLTEEIVTLYREFQRSPVGSRLKRDRSLVASS